MSRTLNLVDRLLTLGRHFQEIGRERDALQVLGRLSDLKGLPADVAEETHVRLAEMNLRGHDYRAAQRNLGAAIRYNPENARYHYWLATAFDADDDSNPERAREHYERSLEIDPDQADCLSDFGLLALCTDREEEGLDALRRAAALEPDDPEIVGKLVEGLSEMGEVEEARQTLRAGLFRNSRDPHFQKLWSDFQFQQLWEAQARERGEFIEQEIESDEPVVLPFDRATVPFARPKPARKPIRHDGAAAFGDPHTWPGKRHA
jgi:Tfp pilus assembly protein PilF